MLAVANRVVLIEFNAHPGSCSWAADTSSPCRPAAPMSEARATAPADSHGVSDVRFSRTDRAHSRMARTARPDNRNRTAIEVPVETGDFCFKPLVSNQQKIM